MSATLSRSGVGANDFSLRTFGTRPVGGTRWEMGVDVNGRYGLRSWNSRRVEDPIDDFAWMARDLVVNDDEIEVAFLKEQQARIGS